MTHRIRFVRAASVAAALAFIATLAVVHTANAQLVWNPPCNLTTIVNTTNCPALLNIVTNPAGAFPVVVVPAGATIVVPTPANPLIINGVISLANIFYPVMPPGAGSPCPAAGSWWIDCVRLGPPPGCCFYICFNPFTCTIRLFACPNVTPPCRP